MYLDSQNKQECCGCSACQQICPTNCIEMQRDEEGFLFPVLSATERCIHCDRCRQVCDFCRPPRRTEDSPACFYGWHADAQTRRNSTSGAAFVGLVQACRQKGYTHVYGAVMDGQCRVLHRGQPIQNALESFTGSKYAQSNMLECFSEIKKIISDGGKVIFSGTPCQVAGLQSFLGPEKRKSLFSIALVCHGVASPAALETYLRQLAQRKGSAVTGLRFRDKSSALPTVVYENGTSGCTPNDSYMEAYQSGAMTRESCFVCPYTTTSREADVSIGDFWGVEKWIPALSGELKNGISLLLSHTQAGRDMLECCRSTNMVIGETPLKAACNPRQPNLSRPPERSFLRDRFLKRVLSPGVSFEKETKKTVFLWKVRRKIKHTLSK